jgi:hypothetical protein
MLDSLQKCRCLILKSIIIIFLCLCNFCICAQDKKQIAADSTQLANASTYFIDSNLLRSRIQTYSYPFDSIIFRDVRSDTTAIGVTNKIAFLSDKNRFRYITFTMGLSGFLNFVLNNQKSSSSNFNTAKLICYIKRFRITELDSTYETNVKKQRLVQIKSAIDVFYFHNKQMYPAFRTDTTFLQLLAENKGTYVIIDSLLRSFTERVSKIDTGRILKRKSFSEEKVDSMYKQRFALPILKVASLKKGVYTSKEDFFNNAPSMPEYEWKPEKKVNILYTKDEKNQWNVTRKNVFGFCDGVNIWLRVQDGFYPAFRKGNTFEFIAPLLLKRLVNNQPTTVSVPVGGYTYFLNVNSKYSSIYYQDKSVYQIDMETAGFY